MAGGEQDAGGGGARRTGWGRALFASFLCLVFAGMGAFFLVLLGAELGRIVATWTWAEVPCTILASGVDTSDHADTDDDTPFRVTVRYEYEAGGRRHVSESYRHGYAGERSIGTAEAIAGALRPGSEHTAFVNPSDPGDAVLTRKSPLIGFLLFIPLVFLAFGLGGLYFIWKGRGRAARDRPRPLSNQSGKPGSGRVAALVVGVVLLLVGLVVTPLWSVPLLGKAMASRDWPEVACRVLSSRVGEHSDSDGTSYSVDIVYSYIYGGREYRSDRYELMGGSSSGRASKKRIVARYPPGATRTCRVNPDNPSEAILVPGFRAIYLVSLIPGVLGVVGIGILVGALVSRRGGPEAAWREDPEGRVVLRPKTGRVAKAVGALVIALFWNGIVGLLGWFVVGEWREGERPWLAAGVLALFALVGVALLGAFVRGLMQLANPRIRLALTPAAPRLGGSIRIEWSVDGDASRIGRLTIELTGAEEARYQRGTSTHTDRSVFHREAVVSLAASASLRQGSAAGGIPGGLVPTLELTNNRILWSLHVTGEIRGWPDISDEYPLRVRPLGGHP